MSIVNRQLPKQLKRELKLWEHTEGNKGQVYTRPEVVVFMLKVIGLDDLDGIENVRILEPSCGEGEFVVAIVQRLIKDKPNVDKLLGSLVAVDLVGTSIGVAKAKVTKLLAQHNYSAKDIAQLLDDWFLQADFLLEDLDADFTHVIGNPPYVRLESIPKTLLKDYRQRFKTMTDRADLYIPFFEKSLSLLRQDGKLSFLCTDRWTKNTYGRALRQFISGGYSLEVFIDLYNSDAFASDVLTYPAITQIVNKPCSETVLYKTKDFSDGEAVDILKAVNGQKTNVECRKGIVDGPKPWLVAPKVQSSLIHKLEQNFPTLEEAGCRVHVGVATGANKVFIVDKDEVDIEASRLVPAISASELSSGELAWAGKYMINTFDTDGVIDLEDYPKLATYLAEHKHVLSNRYKAKKGIVEWYRTLGRVEESRANSPKLLIPDISHKPIVVYDQGKFQPNNSMYYES